MHVTTTHADFAVVLRQVLGHALSQGGDKHTLFAFNTQSNLVQQVVDLAFYRSNLNLRINQSRGPDDLLDHDAC